MALFKVGDKVRIKKREGSVGDYRFGFTDDMSKLAGKVATVAQCHQSCGEFPLVPDDGYLYRLKVGEEGAEFCWASNMLESVTSSNFNPIVINDEDSIKLNFKL